MNHGFLKQSTASQSRMIGPFVDDTDFKTAETGLTIANTDIKLSKNGAAGVNKNSGGGTHRNNGMYSITFDATDTNTVGELEGSVIVSGALVVIFKFMVLEEAVYDALFASGAAGYVLSSDLPANFSSLGISSGGAVTEVNLAKVTTDVTNEVSADITKISGAATAAGNLELMYDGTGYTDDTAPASRAQVNNLNDLSQAEANAACDQALTDYDGPTKTEMDSSFAALNNVSQAEVNTACDQSLSDYDGPTKTEMDAAFTEIKGAGWNSGTDTLEQIRNVIDALNDLSAAEVNAEISDVLKTDTVAEMSQGAPPAAPTMEEILNYLYRKLRNKEETTGSETATYDDAGTTKLFKSTLSDNGTTFTKGESGSGA